MKKIKGLEGYRKWIVLVVCSMVVSCAHKQSSPVARETEKKVEEPPKMEGAQLDEKAQEKVNRAFLAIVGNDEKKAKAAYGRSYKYMPELVQFAFDLRFKNFDHASELLNKLPYSESEKIFWQNIIKSKPRVISKAICEDLKKREFNILKVDAVSEEVQWFKNIHQVMDRAYREELHSKQESATPGEIDKILAKIVFKDSQGNYVPLDSHSQELIFNEAFFDKLRNAQRRDTRFWLESYHNPLKAWTYKRSFSVPYVYDLYSSLKITEAPRQPHYLRRLKGIVKDLRVENSLFRQRGNILIDDSEDLKKAISISNFMNRYLILSALLNLDPSLAGCN